MLEKIITHIIGEHFHSGPGWLNELGSWITEQFIETYNQYGVGSRPAL